MNKQKKIPTLRSIKFAVGFKCNLDCGFCLQLRSNKASILDFGLVKKVMQEKMVKEDVKLITLTGGEPTYGPYLELSQKIVKHAHSMGKETCIFTNGILIDEKILKDFHKAGLNRFRVSLYDPINWNQTKELMKRLNSFGFPAMVKYTVTKENFSNLKEVLENIPKSGVEWFQIKPYNRVELPKMDHCYELYPDQVLSMAKLLLKFRKQFPKIEMDFLPLCYEFLVDNNLPIENLSPCNCGKGPLGYLVVDPSGDVKICGAYPKPIGNVKQDTLTDLWKNHPSLKKVRNLANRPKPKECKGCKYWEKCARTDCHSATFAKYGNFKYGNPQCPLVFKKINKC